MRYDARHKEETHRQLLDIAGQLLRTGGPEAVSVTQVMGEAGLTNGGFYAHFRSREDLLAQAIERAFRDATAMFERARDGRAAAEALPRYVRSYLSAAHRDMPGLGCPVPALGADALRLSDAARACFAGGVDDLVKRIATLVEALGIEQPQAVARSILAEMSGAITLSRIVAEDADASAAILHDARRSALSRVGLEQRA